MLIPPAECYRDKHSISTEHPYSPEANDIWSLGVLFLELACGDRIWDVPCNTDARYRDFSADPPSFLRAEYPLNDRTLHFLLRILSPESHRTSLKALRQEISSIDEFYLSDSEIATATAQVQENAIRYGPWTKLVDGLDDVPYEEDGEDLFTDSDDDSSTGEFVDISLTTPESERLGSSCSVRGLKDEKQLASRIAGLNLFTR
jgi:serine/threonine protein kinase